MPLPLHATVKGWLSSPSAKELLSDAGWVLVLRLVRQVLAILVVAILVRLVSKDDFGRYQLVVTLVGLFAVTSPPGVARAIIQSVARGRLGTFREGTRLSFRFSFAGALLMLLVAGWFFYQGDMPLALALAAGALLFPATQGLNQWQSLQIGRKQFRENSLRISIGVIAAAVCTIAAPLAGFTKPYMLVIAAYIALAMQNVIQQRIALASVPEDAEVEEGSIHYALHTSVWDVFNTIANYVDRLMVFMISPAALAAYAVADRIPEVLKVNMQQAMSVLVPRFAERKRYTRSLDRKLTLVSLVAIVAILFVTFAILPFVFPILYGEEYISSLLICQLVLVSMACGAPAITKNAFINARLDKKGQRNVMAVSAVIRIASSVGLVIWLGILGAAISTILYRLSTTFLVEWHLRRHYLEPKEAGRG